MVMHSMFEDKLKRMDKSKQNLVKIRAQFSHLLELLVLYLKLIVNTSKMNLTVT